jgi:glycyl-tRNA synthetase beta chain
MHAKDLIFEIGTEEIPSSFAPRALTAIEDSLKKAFNSKGLSFNEIKAMGTPRRLSFIAKGLIDRQPDSVIEVKGPQKKAAFDDSGNPTKALIGFAGAQGAEVKDILVKKTDRHEYVYVVKEIKGRDTEDLLPEILGNIMSADYFPKSMRWGSHDVSFARPVHWLFSMYGGKPVRFEWGHLKSSEYTFGHRFMDSGDARLKPEAVADYIDGLRSLCVILDQEERKGIIRRGIEASAKEVGGEVLPDEGLVNEVAFLVEYPQVIRGSIDRGFLDLPRDIVINAMREHQRYFTVVDEKGSLLPYFLTVANTPTINADIVIKGNERVLRARLNDAKFYFEKDIKKSLVEMAQSLKGVVFQARLGTSYEKVERFCSLALCLGEKLGFSRPIDKDTRPEDFLTDSLNPSQFDSRQVDAGFYSMCVLGRAAMLSKADLTSGVVGEFPKLQGIMGSIYARRAGEAEEVSLAIYEHYLPIQSGGAPPPSVAGSIISIADKMDTIAGCFCAGLIPTGAQDPYGLRRQALGIIAIIIQKGFTVPLDEVLDNALNLLEKRLARKKEDVKREVLEFFKERLKFMLLSEGLSFDSIDSVLSVDWFDIIDAIKRIRAIEGFKRHPNFAGLTIAFKRVSNILKGVSVAKAPDKALFKEPREDALYEVSLRLGPVIEGYRKRGEYEKVFNSLAEIKDIIDAFFDKVLVMAEDKETRENRLRLVNSIRDLYFRTADLSRLGG